MTSQLLSFFNSLFIYAIWNEVPKLAFLVRMGNLSVLFGIIGLDLSLVEIKVTVRCKCILSFKLLRNYLLDLIERNDRKGLLGFSC